MEIIEVYHHDPCDKGKGGAVRYISNLLKFLPRKGIITILLGAKFVDCNQHFNFQFKPIIEGSNKFFNYFFNLFIKLPFLDINNQAIIHVHRMEYVIPFLFFKRNNPVLLTLHGERLATGKTLYSKSIFFLISKMYILIEYLAFRRAKYIVAVSKDVKNSFLNSTKNSKLNIKIIPVGVDLELFKPLNKETIRKKYNIDKKTKVILFVGVLGKVKNLKLLITSFSIYVMKYPNSLLIIVGDGSEKKSLEELVSELSLSSKVKFMGEIKNDRLPEIYNLADIFAFTSLSEGSPTVIREALACGIPVISTDVGDVKNIIGNVNVGLISSKNENDYAENISRVFNLLRNGKNNVEKECRNTVSSYGFNTVVDQYIEIFK